MFSRRTDWTLEPNRLSRLAERRRGAGDLIDLTVSNPTQCGFDYERPAILRAIGQAAALRYDPDPRGLEPARRAIADYYRQRGLEMAPERIFLTPGTSEAYSHLFRLLCNPGDAVLAPTPSYPLFDLLADLNDIRLEPYRLLYDHGWQVDLAGLERAISAPSSDPGAAPRALLVIHPNNPTGSYLKPPEWARIQALAAGHRLAVIVDEVFWDYPLEVPASNLPYAEAPALTFVLNGLSKLAALPQMKLGWIAVHGLEELAQAAAARLEIIHDVYLSVDTPMQWAAAALLDTRKAMQPQIAARTRENLALLDRKLAPAGAARSAAGRLRVEGGWNAILRLPRIRTDEEWAELLVEHSGVLTHPGHFYGMAQEAHLIISLLPPTPTFEAGLTRLLAHI